MPSVTNVKVVPPCIVTGARGWCVSTKTGAWCGGSSLNHAAVQSFATFTERMLQALIRARHVAAARDCDVAGWCNHR
jgi:hypothetical protein